jgi:hypothetical protein
MAARWKRIPIKITGALVPMLCLCRPPCRPQRELAQARATYVYVPIDVQRVYFWLCTEEETKRNCPGLQSSVVCPARCRLDEHLFPSVDALCVRF